MRQIAMQDRRCIDGDFTIDSTLQIQIVVTYVLALLTIRKCEEALKNKRFEAVAGPRNRCDDYCIS